MVERKNAPFAVKGRDLLELNSSKVTSNFYSSARQYDCDACARSRPVADTGCGHGVRTRSTVAHLSIISPSLHPTLNPCIHRSIPYLDLHLFRFSILPSFHLGHVQHPIIIRTLVRTRGRRRFPVRICDLYRGIMELAQISFQTSPNFNIQWRVLTVRSSQARAGESRA